MRLLVGDAIVYAPHGVGRIVAREERSVLGSSQEVLVLELADGLAVTLTVARAQDAVRPPVDEAEMAEVEATLREDGDLSDAGWLQRRRVTDSKLSTGNALALAEVVRDGARREQKSGRGALGLSAGERSVYLRARKLLADEIALVRGVEPEAADAWIDERLTPAT